MYSSIGLSGDRDDILPCVVMRRHTMSTVSNKPNPCLLNKY